MFSFFSSNPHVKVLNTQPRSVEGYASCLAYWRHVTGSRRRTCCAIGCSNNIYDCAVVNIREEGYGNKWYYVPLCIHHLTYPEEIPIDSRTSLVSARADLVGNRDRNSKVVKVPTQSQWAQLFQQQQQQQQPQQQNNTPTPTHINANFNTNTSTNQTPTDENKEEFSCCGFVILLVIFLIYIFN